MEDEVKVLASVFVGLAAIPLVIAVMGGLQSCTTVTHVPALFAPPLPTCWLSDVYVRQYNDVTGKTHSDTLVYWTCPRRPPDRRG